MDTDREAVVYRVIVAALVLAGLTSLVVWGSLRPPPEVESDLREEHASSGYSSGFQSSLSEARAQAGFDLKVPHHAYASAENIQTVYLFPGGGAVVLVFPLPRSPQAPLREDVRRIEIFQQPWEAGDPRAEFQQSIQADPAGGTMYEVNGVPMLADAPHSDETGEDGAYLELALNGVSIQLSGGESVEDLIEIAKTLDGFPGGGGGGGGGGGCDPDLC